MTLVPIIWASMLSILGCWEPFRAAQATANPSQSAACVLANSWLPHQLLATRPLEEHWYHVVGNRTLLSERRETLGLWNSALGVVGASEPLPLMPFVSWWWKPSAELQWLWSPRRRGLGRTGLPVWDHQELGYLAAWQVWYSCFLDIFLIKRNSYFLI